VLYADTRIVACPAGSKNDDLPLRAHMPAADPVGIHYRWRACVAVMIIAYKISNNMNKMCWATAAASLGGMAWLMNLSREPTGRRILRTNAPNISRSVRIYVWRKSNSCNTAKE